jgi:hypothetical protein
VRGGRLLAHSIFANGVGGWLALSVIRRRRRGRVPSTVGDVLLGPVSDVVPTPVGERAETRPKGTASPVLFLGAFLAIFVSGVLDADVLSVLGTADDAVTRGVTVRDWVPLQVLWSEGTSTM